MRRSSRCYVTLFAIVETSCYRKAPPRADEIERPAFEMPVPEAPRGPFAGYMRPPRIREDLALAMIGDTVVLGDRPTCTVALFARALASWRHVLPGCEKGLAVAMRPDGVVLARIENLLVAWSPDGAERWRLELGGREGDHSFARIAVLPDSHIVVAVDPTLIVNVSEQGRESWRFALPADAMLVAPPVALRTEGLVLFTRSGALFLHSDGTPAGHTEGGRT